MKMAIIVHSLRERMEIMDYMKEFFRGDFLARHLGIELLEVSAGKARAKMPLREFHKNSLGSVHGGAIFSLADFVFAAASNSHGRLAVAISAHISYLKALEKGTLYAEAKESSLGPKLATYEIEITDDDENLIAVFHGMVYRKKQEIDFEKGTIGLPG